MILFKPNRVAFAFPAKTGSTTADHFLRNAANATRLPNRHEIPKDLLKKFPGLSEYQIYAFLRNPLHNFISKVNFIRKADGFKDMLVRNSVSKTADELTYDDFVDLYSLIKLEPLQYITNSQSVYFQVLNVEALDFDNYEAELRRATQGLGLDEFPIQHLNATTDTGVVTQKVIDFVKAEYADDCQLWFEKFGRRIDQ